MTAHFDATAYLTSSYAMLWAIGSTRLWNRSSATTEMAYRLLWGMGGIGCLIAMQLSPFHHWSEELFTFHMIEHEILMAVAAPLLVLSRPGAALLWALPRQGRQGVGRAVAAVQGSSLWAWLSRKSVATLLHGFAIWAWHLPTLFEWAIADHIVHWLQHLSFFATGLLFWWALLRRPLAAQAGQAVGHLFVTALHTGLLGVLLTFSRRLWYDPAPDVTEWGLTPLEDQQLAGVIMWVPASIVYALAAVAMMALWLRSLSSRREFGDAQT